MVEIRPKSGSARRLASREYRVTTDPDGKFLIQPAHGADLLLGGEGFAMIWGDDDDDEEDEEDDYFY